MELKGLRIASLVEDTFEDLELWYPTHFLRSLGCEVVLVGPEAGGVYTGKHGVPCKAEAAYDVLDVGAFDGVLIPGGFAPDKLRRVEAVLLFVRGMDQAGKLVGHICHAGWVPASARICVGRRMTSTPGIRDDLVHAGATWVDEEAVIDRNMVSSRQPSDLPAYGNALAQVLRTQRRSGGPGEQAEHEQRHQNA